MLIRSFKNLKELIIELEKLSNLSFSQNTLELVKTKGYLRVKNIICFMIHNNLKISNRNIQTLYRREKHLRHMLMPQIETFELKFSNALLMVTIQKTNGTNIFDKTKNLFINSKLSDTKFKIKESISKSLKKSIDFSIESPFDYFPYLTLGNLINIFKTLKPKFKISIMKKAYNLLIDKNIHMIDSELWVILTLRNYIAHGSQLFSKKGMSIQRFLKNNLDPYTYGLESFMQETKFEELSKNTINHIDKFNSFIKKIKM